MCGVQLLPHLLLQLLLVCMLPFSLCDDETCPMCTWTSAIPELHTPQHYVRDAEAGHEMVQKDDCREVSKRWLL